MSQGGDRLSTLCSLGKSLRDEYISFFLEVRGGCPYMYFRFENTPSDNQVSLFCYYHLLRPND